MKKILSVILMVLVLSLTACGSSSADTPKREKEITCYLKWSDGEEEIALDHRIIGTNGIVFLYTTDGQEITTHMSNVIIIEK